MGAADGCIPTTGRSVKRRIPGWTELVQPYRDKAVFWHNIWQEAGRPHEGYTALIRRSTRAAYHRAIRQVIREHDEIVKDRIASCLLTGCNRDFWSEIQKIRGHGRSVPSVIDNVNKPEDIANLFASSYRSLFSSVSSDREDMSSVHDAINSKLVSDSVNKIFTVSAKDVAKAVRGLNHGKKDGNNILSSEFFIHAPSQLHVHLSLLFTAIIMHGVVIDDMRTGTIIPIPKPGANTCETSSYRGIALSSIVGKIIDLILLDRLSDYLVTSDLQFGFKRNHSTSMCTFILKETVAYYTSNCISVYCCFLDATKAFDRVCHAKLFKLLVDRGLPAVVIRFLVHLYNEH
jgi:hypothetical protein